MDCSWVLSKLGSQLQGTDGLWGPALPSPHLGLQGGLEMATLPQQRPLGHQDTHGHEEWKVESLHQEGGNDFCLVPGAVAFEVKSECVPFWLSGPQTS